MYVVNINRDIRKEDSWKLRTIVTRSILCPFLRPVITEKLAHPVMPDWCDTWVYCRNVPNFRTLTGRVAGDYPCPYRPYRCSLMS